MASENIRQLAEAALTLETLSTSVVSDRRRSGRPDVSPVLIPLLRSSTTIDVSSHHDEDLSEDSLSADCKDRRMPHGLAVCAVLSASLWAIIILAVRASLG